MARESDDVLPFAAGNFIYIAAADLLPELGRRARTRDKIETTVAVMIGLGVMLVVAP